MGDSRLQSHYSRLEFYRTLGADAEYLKIREHTKVPVGSFLKGKRNRYKRVPKEGNYGVIPQGRLLVLDIDVHRGGKIDEQIEAFSLILGLDLTKTLIVNTPSGGIHLYLRLPDSDHSVYELPKTTLRTLQSDIQKMVGKNLIIDADIRSEAANAYVVGPGSIIGPEKYTFANNYEILIIPEEGMNLLIQLRKNYERAKLKKKENIDLWINEPVDIPVSIDLLNTEVPSSLSLEKIARAIDKRGFTTYHQKRAFVKAALHCCFSNDAIARACVALNVNKDSFTELPIHRYALQMDIHQFTPTLHFHGPYCPVGMARRRNDQVILSPREWEEHLVKLLAKRTARANMPANEIFIKSNFRVLNVKRISEELKKETKRGARAKQYQHVMLILECFLQPLVNVGAEKILISQDFLREELNLTGSQVSQALRLLRKLRVIELRDRQKQGFAPTYVVHGQYIHKKLTFHLRRTWVEEKNHGEESKIIYSPRLGGLVRALSKTPVFTNTLAHAISVEDRAILEEANPDAPNTSVLVRYLRTEI